MGSENKKDILGKDGGNHNTPRELTEHPTGNIIAKENPSFAFAYKKTEKLIQALYLVTNFISADEPLRIRLRELSMDLLSSILSFSSRSLSRKESVSESPQAMIFEITALLGIALSAGYISEMNYNVLKREYNMLSAFLEERADTVFLRGTSIHKHFFEVDVEKKPQEERYFKLAEEAPQGKDIKDIVKRTKGRVQGATPRGKIGIGPISKRRDERRAAILSLLKRQKKITVKDVSSVVENCSEKTLQRELLALVEEGILRKEGERRWSTYSLS